MSRYLMVLVVCGACSGEDSLGGRRDAGADVDANSGVDAATANSPGTHLHTLTVGTLTREVIVYVPAIAEDALAPAVVMTHGTSQDGQWFYENSGWKEEADTDGMIVLFPTALTHCYHEDENGDGDFVDPGERKVTTKWAAGRLGTADDMPLCTADEIAALPAAERALVDHPMADDLAFFDAMLELLAGSYVVDDKAIYVTGFSNGAEMSSRIAVERSEVVAAGHSQAGMIGQDPPVAARPLSFIFSLGTLDDRYTVPAGLTEIPLTEPELSTLPFIRAIVNRFTTTLQLTTDYAYELIPIGDGKRAAHFRFTTSTVGASNTFDLYVLEDLYHQYPNGLNHPVNLPEQLWTFFQTQRLP